MEHLAKRAICQYNSITPKLNLCIFNYHLLNFTRNLKLMFRILLSYLTLPPTRTASLVFDPSFVLVIHSHFHLSFTLTSLDAGYVLQ